MADPAVQTYLSQMQAEGGHDEATEAATTEAQGPAEGIHDVDGEIDLS